MSDMCSLMRPIVHFTMLWSLKSPCRKGPHEVRACIVLHGAALFQLLSDSAKGYVLKLTASEITSLWMKPGGSVLCVCFFHSRAFVFTKVDVETTAGRTLKINGETKNNRWLSSALTFSTLHYTRQIYVCSYRSTCVRLSFSEHTLSTRHSL